MAMATLRLPSPARVRSFLDLKPESKSETLRLDLPRHDSPATLYDAAIIGCGPAGLRLAEQASARGLRVCLVDPSPLSLWPNNYGAWLDELRPMGLESFLDHSWPTATVHIDSQTTKHLSRPYGRISRRQLKSHLLASCAANNVRFHAAKGWSLDHSEFESTVHCSHGGSIRASLVVDASGFSTPFISYDRPRDHGYQVAHGVLAEVESHPFDLGSMLLMDWRDSHLDSEPYLRAGNDRTPTFLYAMPLDRNLIFLEETSLVSRPILSYPEIKKRMAARVRHLGIRMRKVVGLEKCVIPMGGPLPPWQRTFGFGGAGGMAHPATGYMAVRSMALAGPAAEAMAEALGTVRMIRGKQLADRIWGAIWTEGRRGERECYRFGMETVLRMDLESTRRFFKAFFELEKYYWEGFLSSRLSVAELAKLSLHLFGKASLEARMDIVTKCPAPLARMVGNLALRTY